jgi:hypothetical protein
MSDQDDEPWSSHGGLPNRIIIQSGFSAVVCGVGGFVQASKAPINTGQLEFQKECRQRGNDDSQKAKAVAMAGIGVRLKFRNTSHQGGIPV